MKLDFLLPEKKPCDIRKITWSKRLTLLVMAPHPDDFDAIGETLKYMQNTGHDIHVVVAETGSGIDDAYMDGLSLLKKRAKRNEEQRESARFFGLPDANLHFLALENEDDDQIADSEQNRFELAKWVKKIKPDILFLPHGNDTNRAHRAMYLMARQIASSVKWSIAMMLNQDAKTVSINPWFYYAFGEKEAKWKAQLLRFHDSQQGRNLKLRGYGFDKRVLRLNNIIAKELGIDKPYASAFEVEIYPSRDT